MNVYEEVRAFYEGYRGEKRIIAKSVLNVMAAGIKCGTEINLICDGVDEEEALKAMSAAIESGLGEM